MITFLSICFQVFLCKLRVMDIIVVIFSVIREKKTLMMNDENKTDGRVHKLLRLSFFFLLFHLIQTYLFLFFSLSSSPILFPFLSLWLLVVVLYRLHEQEKKRNETNINLLSTNRRKPADVRSKAIGWFGFIFLKNKENTYNMYI